MADGRVAALGAGASLAACDFRAPGHSRASALGYCPPMQRKATYRVELLKADVLIALAEEQVATQTQIGGTGARRRLRHR
jgi:hypothetical protein